MNALPILLLGGAALLMMSGKKKKSGSFAAPALPEAPKLNTTQKKEMSGYGNVTRDRMQWIQRVLLVNGYAPGEPDGKYGAKTQQAVFEFQEDYGLKADGKPGSKTQDALRQAEADILGAVAPPKGAAKPSSTVPSVSGFQIGFNETLTKYKMGVNWKTGVLDKWLNQQRLYGMLATRYADDGELWEDANPHSMSSKDIWTATAVAVGTLAMGAFAVSTAGAGAAVIAGAADYGLIQWGFLMAGDVTMVAMGSGKLSDIWNGPRGRVIEGSAATAFVEFIRTHKVKVSGGEIPIYALKPTPAVLEFHKQILKYILKFQSSEF